MNIMAPFWNRRRGSTPAPPNPQSGEATAVLATVAAALDTGAILLDNHEVVLANEAALGMRVVRGTSLTAPLLARLVRAARLDGVRHTEDVELPYGASTRAVRATAAPVPGSDQVVLLLHDLAEARRVDAVRRDFVANVSHELKTPVGALLLLAEAIRDGVDDPVAARRFADRMMHEAGRLARLVQELLELSRVQGGDPLPDPNAVAVGRLVTDAMDRVRLAAVAAGIEVVAADAGDLAVWGDERSLVTALTNLLENAISYSSPATRVGVGARLRETLAGDEVEIAVSDQGIGIPAGDLQRVFERFYRSDPARSRATGGTGLGLAIVKHIAENHGGRVSVWSSEGVGSTFTLHLPTPPMAAAADAPTAPAMLAGRPG
jgi:two-component system sensor histidine kinase SenX3